MEAGTVKPSLRFLKRKESLVPASYFSDSPVTLDSLRLILSLPASQRSPNQVEVLVSFSKHLKIFTGLRNEVSVDAHYQCCQHLTYEFFPAGEFVFHEGDEGTKFFIILQGSCSVLTQVETPESKMDYRLLTIVRQGECFGELALISHMPRAAGVMCREDTHFAVLERNDYTRILGRLQDHQLQVKVELLQRHPVFAKWTKNSLQRLSYFFKVRQYKRKHVLFTAGVPANEVFLIKSGDFQLTKDVQLGLHSLNSAKAPHSHVDVTLVSEGEILGAKEVIENCAFSYTCTCSSSQAEAMAILREDFKQVMSSEETVDYLLSMNRKKEEYREDRLKAAMKVEHAKRKVTAHKSNRSLLATSRSMTLLKNDLLRGKSGIYSPSFDPLIDVPTCKPLQVQTLRLGNSSAFSAKSLEARPKPTRTPTMSWGDVFISKYSLSKPAHLVDLKRPADSSPHAKSRRDINIRFKQLHFMMRSAENSKSSLLAKGTLLTYGNSLFTISQRHGHANS